MPEPPAACSSRIPPRGAPPRYVPPRIIDQEMPHFAMRYATTAARSVSDSVAV
jgi:hypothetical protein